MKNNINKYISIITLMVVSLTFTSCLDEEVDFGEDASKVVAKIFSFSGPEVSYEQETALYSVGTRAGSEFIWNVTGGEAQPVAGGTSQMNVFFTEPGTATVSVYEKTANGQESETSTMSVNVFGLPCNWTLVTHDTYGDGWNGGYIEVITNGITTQYVQPAGPADVTHLIAISNAAEYSIAYVSGGGTGGSPGWESENYFKLTAPDGTVYESGSLDYSSIPTEGVVSSGTNACP